MRLVLHEETEPVIRLSLRQSGDTIALIAEGGELRRTLLVFSASGKVERPDVANIGSFKFDNRGRLVID